MDGVGLCDVWRSFDPDRREYSGSAVHKNYNTVRCDLGFCAFRVRGIVTNAIITCQDTFVDNELGDFCKRYIINCEAVPKVICFSPHPNLNKIFSFLCVAVVLLKA